MEEWRDTLDSVSLGDYVLVVEDQPQSSVSATGVEETPLGLEEALLGLPALELTSADADTRRFKCPSCPYAATRKDVLANHVLALHAEGSRPFRCHLCDFDTTRKGTLTRHVAVVHENARPHSCPSCPYKCASRDKLKRHQLKKHKGGRKEDAQVKSAQIKRTKLVKNESKVRK